MADQAPASGAENGIKAAPDALAEALPLSEQRRWLVPSVLEGAPLPSPIRRWLQAQGLQLRGRCGRCGVPPPGDASDGCGQREGSQDTDAAGDRLPQ